VIADIDTYGASAAALAARTKAIVASVGYRQAPENRFPAAHEDAIAAYRRIIENAGPFSGDSDRVAVAGESAGGNLAINTAIAARDQRLNQPEHMLLVYPVAGTALDTPSFQEQADAVPLGRAAMAWRPSTGTTRVSPTSSSAWRRWWRRRRTPSASRHGG
jgi:acetyl esterase